MNAMDQFSQQAFSVLSSGRFAEAMDLSREDPKVVARYMPDGEMTGDHAPTRDINADRPGRTFDRSGEGRHRSVQPALDGPQWDLQGV